MEQNNVLTFLHSFSFEYQDLGVKKIKKEGYLFEKDIYRIYIFPNYYDIYIEKLVNTCSLINCATHNEPICNNFLKLKFPLVVKGNIIQEFFSEYNYCYDIDPNIDYNIYFNFNNPEDCFFQIYSGHLKIYNYVYRDLNLFLNFLIFIKRKEEV